MEENQRRQQKTKNGSRRWDGKVLLISVAALQEGDWGGFVFLLHQTKVKCSPVILCSKGTFTCCVWIGLFNRVEEKKKNIRDTSVNRTRAALLHVELLSARTQFMSCWRAPQQGGFGLSGGIEHRPCGWSTATPITTPPCRASQQQYKVKRGTGTTQSSTSDARIEGFLFFLWCFMFERNVMRQSVARFTAVTDNVLSLDLPETKIVRWKKAAASRREARERWSNARWR